MVRSGERPPGDAVAVEVPVATPGLLQALDALGVEDLATVEGCFGIRKRVGHPVVHPEVEVGEDEDGRLEPLGEVERLDGHREALLRRGGEQDRMLAVAMGIRVADEDVALHRPGRQAGRRADALHVEDDGRNLGVVAVADQLRHEGYTGA